MAVCTMAVLTMAVLTMASSSSTSWPPYRARTIPNPEAYPPGVSAGRAAAPAATAALRMRPRPARQP
eukprot:scaffold67362_cov75-Phaeocystis_antarctica.AAC.1